jgi:hypothetical protein
MDVPERGKPETTTMGCFLDGDFLEENNFSIVFFYREEAKDAKQNKKERKFSSRFSKTFALFLSSR